MTMIKGILSGLMVCVMFVGCVPEPRQAVSDSGVTKATARVQTGSDGLSTEQRNIKQRIELENKPGSIKHLYVVSPFTGDVLVYSTVKGKVSSSGKRLTPKSVNWSVNPPGIADNGDYVKVNGKWYVTTELLQDDGTYGDSSEYLFWFDASGKYYQMFVGGLTVVLSDQPIPVSKSKLNFMDLGEEANAQ
jgi:hypothetical protein